MRAVIVGGPHDGAVIEMNDTPPLIELEVEKRPESIGSAYAGVSLPTLIRHQYHIFKMHGPSETNPDGQCYLIYRHDCVSEGDVLGKILDGYLRQARDTTGS